MIITRTTATVFEWFVGVTQEVRVTDSFAFICCFDRCSWPVAANQTPGEVMYKLLNFFNTIG